MYTKNEPKVYTKFKDPSGKDVEPPVEGIVGKKEIPGYTYKGTDKDKDGNIIHTYTKNEPKVYTKFKDPSGKDVEPPVEGIVGKKEIPGYTYKGTNKDKDGNIIHTYTKNEPKVYTKFKDPSGKDVEPPVEGIVGKKEIPGYTYKGTDKDKDGNIIHTYVGVKTFFKDPSGAGVIPPVDGIVGKKEIPGYTYKGTEKDKDGNIVHTYMKNEPKVKTFFKDPSGEGVIPPADGIVGAKEIPGYTYKGTEKDKDGNVIHTYTKNEPKVYTKFKDPSGRDVEPPVEGIVGKKDIPGYIYKGADKDKDGNTIHTYVGVKTFFKDPSGLGVIPPVDGIVGKKEIPGYTYNGTDKDKDGNIVHTYTKNEPNVKTYFKDPSGEGVIPPVDGIVGKKEIPGYTYKGTEKDKDGNIIHTYTRNTPKDPNDGEGGRDKKVITGNGIDENGNPIEPPVLEVPEYTGVTAGNGLDGEGNIIEPPKVDIPEYTGDATEKSKEELATQLKVNKPKEQSKGQHKSEEKPAGKKLPETGDPVSLASLGLASLIGARKLRRKR